jgi:uncharacterized membrane protein
MTSETVQRTRSRAALLTRPHVAFMVVACVFGVAFAVTLPSLAGYDEPVHFLRAWHVSEGNVFAQTGHRAGYAAPTLGAYVPLGLRQELEGILLDGILRKDNARRTWSHVDDPAPAGRPVFVDFSAAAVYPPVPYLPSAIGIRVGRLFGASAWVLVLLARLAQLAAFIALVGLAVRRLPSRRWILAVVALLPVALFQASTVSADAITNALALLVVADALALTAQPVDGVPTGLVVETAAATIALALCKQPYILAAGLLLIPAWRHRRQIGAALVGTFAVGAALALAWNRWADDHYLAPDFLPASLGGHANYANNNVHPSAQIRYVRGHPFAFTGAVWRMVTEHGPTILHDLTAQVSWWRAPTLLALLAWCGVGAVVLLDTGRLPGGRRMRALALGLSLLTIVVSLFLAYVGWNAVHAPRIDGYQGRYLLVVLAIVALVLIPDPKAASTDAPAGALATLRARVGDRTGWLVAWSALMLLAVEIGILWHSYV